MAKKTKLELTQEETRNNLNKVNLKINELGSVINESLNVLKKLQNVFDKIRNVSEDKLRIYNQVKALQSNWEKEVISIEKEFQAKINSNIVGAGGGGAVGIGIAAFGPQVAMGVATTFGMASTGTAIAALHGAVATNAALAWLGGGALAVGGGGMELGNFFLALAGPIGWSIGLVSLSFGGYFIWNNYQDKKRLTEIFTLISLRDSKKYKIGFLDVEERIKHIIEESEKIKEAIPVLESFGSNYLEMAEDQQYTLGAYVNLMYSIIELFINPVESLVPKVNEQNIEKFLQKNPQSELKYYPDSLKNIIISLSNFLYGIYISSEDMELLEKSFKRNKDFLKSISIEKNDFNIALIEYAKRVSAC